LHWVEHHLGQEQIRVLPGIGRTQEVVQLRDGECSTSAAARMVEEVRSKFSPKPTKSPMSVPTVKDAVMTSLNLNAPRIKSQKPRKEGGRGKLRMAA